MSPEINELLLALNIKAEAHETAYTFQIQYVYKTQYKKMFPRSKFLKFYKNKCVNQIYVSNTIESINYLNNELKLYK